jgi:hypothetical protein
MTYPDNPHLSFPLSIGSRFAVVDEDSPEEIRQTAAMVLYYEIGERTAIPTFGIRDQALRMNGPDLVEIKHTIETWDDRAVEDLSETDVDEIINDVTINFTPEET